jgi:putative tricarboxylic transport membrane protein
MIRGTILGFCLGVLPGGTGVLASFVSYAMEKKLSKHPERFGTGVIEGVAGPETANNAGSSGAFIPLLTLGIPSNIITSLLFAGLLIHGITPGPQLLNEHPDIFWGLITSMYMGNVFLLVLNLPLIGIWVQILKIPYRFLFPMIVLFCIIGAFSINNSVFDIGLVGIFGMIGYGMRKCGYEFAPLVLAYILGPRLEQAFRQSLIISNGNFGIFFTRPISIACFAIGAFLLILSFKTHSGKKGR